jgi:hypothetical protein
VYKRQEAEKAAKPLDTLLKDAGASEVYEKDVQEENVF